MGRSELDEVRPAWDAYAGLGAMESLGPRPREKFARGRVRRRLASAISVPCTPIRRKALIRTYGMPDRKPPRPDWPAAGARTEQKM